MHMCGSMQDLLCTVGWGWGLVFPFPSPLLHLDISIFDVLNLK